MKEKYNDSCKNTKEVLGNTIDYYKESMSFKVVDNLINKTIDEDKIAAVDDYENIDEKYSKRNYDNYEDEEIVYGFEKKPKRIENTQKVRNGYFNEDYNENLNYNRQNIKREQTIGDRIRQQRQVRNQDYNIYNTRMSNQQDNRYLDRNIMDSRSRLYETRNYDYNYENNRSSSGIKVLTISSFVVFLLILSFLIYKINILSKDIENPTSTIVTFRGKEYNLETLIYENEKFSNKMDKLEKEVSSLQNELQSVFASKVVSNPNINTSNKQNINYEKNVKQDINNKIEKNITNKEVKDIKEVKDSKDTKKPKNEDNMYTNLEEEIFDDTLSYDDLLFEDENYVVKAGDTLSYISQKFYGSKSQVEKIKSINNLKSDNLKEGQILKIPNK